VWSLYSDHPNFERFLTGDRAGHLAAIDLTGCQNDYSEAECVLLAKIDVEEGRRGTEGICQIIGMDDELVWTATGSASVSRWQDVGRKRDRLEAEVSRSDLQESLPSHRSAVKINNQSSAPPAPMVMVNGFIPPRNKNVTPGGGDNSPSQSPNSAPSEQRDSRTVAFAEKVEARNPFDDPEDHPADQEPNLASRRSNHPGLNATASILSVASSQTGVTEYPQGRNGIVYSHLVNLSQAAAIFENNNITESQVNAEASGREGFAGSALSLRRSSLGKPAHIGLTSANGTLNPPDAGDVARRDFLEREIVIEADPVRLHPSEVIRGRHGLIRALMLNDRQHALTVDTGGQVAVWNVIHGRCVGRFDEHDVSGVFQESGYDLRDIAGRGSQEALDIVRERIEGESSTITWCTVDTRIGSLTVHVEENRCFDAEVYADEVGYRGDPAFKEDHRSTFCMRSQTA
jgi:WD repeat-containing protein 48